MFDNDKLMPHTLWQSLRQYRSRLLRNTSELDHAIYVYERAQLVRTELSGLVPTSFPLRWELQLAGRFVSFLSGLYGSKEEL